MGRIIAKMVAVVFCVDAVGTTDDDLIQWAKIPLIVVRVMFLRLLGREDGEEKPKFLLRWPVGLVVSMDEQMITFSEIELIQFWVIESLVTAIATSSTATLTGSAYTFSCIKGLCLMIGSKK